MNPVQRPRDEHGSSDRHPQDQNTHEQSQRAPRDGITPAEQRPSRPSTPGAPGAGEPARPLYGIRVDPEQTSDPAPTPGDDPAGRTGGPFTPPGPGDRTAVARAARRMGRGLSFTLILLGLLAGLALVAMGMWFGWVLGAVLAVLGALGYALVQTRALPVFQDPGEPERRSWSKLWLIPAALLVPGLACLGTAFIVPSWLGPTVPEDLLDDYILAFIVGGMTMVVGAGLGFGLVATARFTRPDDDDSPLRPTDYAERLRERDRSDGDTHYDSDWIRHDPRA